MPNDHIAIECHHNLPAAEVQEAAHEAPNNPLLLDVSGLKIDNFKDYRPVESLQTINVK